MLGSAIKHSLRLMWPACWHLGPLFTTHTVAAAVAFSAGNCGELCALTPGGQGHTHMQDHAREACPEGLPKQVAVLRAAAWSLSPPAGLPRALHAEPVPRAQPPRGSWRPPHPAHKLRAAREPRWAALPTRLDQLPRGPRCQVVIFFVCVSSRSACLDLLMRCSTSNASSCLAGY